MSKLNLDPGYTVYFELNPEVELGLGLGSTWSDAGNGKSKYVRGHP